MQRSTALQMWYLRRMWAASETAGMSHNNGGNWLQVVW